ncbi:hypothetical protein V494_01411, partial [Pseudogymnoascus sp. VKM F-4513 (FW-928)]
HKSSGSNWTMEAGRVAQMWYLVFFKDKGDEDTGTDHNTADNDDDDDTASSTAALYKAGPIKFLRRTSQRRFKIEGFLSNGGEGTNTVAVEWCSGASTISRDVLLSTASASASASASGCEP